MVLWTAGLTVIAGLLFGLIPALAFTRDAGDQPLHSSRAGALMLRSRRLHRGLVFAEVALSIVPLVGAGLMLRTFVNLLRRADRIRVRARRHRPDLARPQYLLHGRAPVGGSIRTPSRASASCRASMEPRSAGRCRWRRSSPPSGSGAATILDPTPSLGMQQSVMPGYFGVMGIPLRAGRDISDDDISHRRRVVVVDERLAMQLWQGDAVGRSLSLGESKQPLEVIGVAGAIRARAIRDADTPTLYVPSHVYEIEQTIVVKNDGADGDGGGRHQARRRGARAGSAGLRYPLDG